MQILKPVLLVLLFCVLGIAIGAGAFYLQKHFFTTTKAATLGVQATPKALATPVPVNHYLDATAKLGIDLPATVLLQPITLTGYSSVNLTSYELLSMKDKLTANTTDTQIYILSSDNTASFASAKGKLQRSLVGSYPTQTLQLATTSGTQITHKQFTAVSGTSADSYEFENTTLYVLVYKNSDNGDAQLTDSDVEKVVKSIKLNSSTPTTATSVSPVITPSASSGYLLQAN
jgi:uncharacterized protein (UPF0333 family)